MKPKFNGLVKTHDVMFGVKVTQHITLRTSPLSNGVVAASCMVCGCLSSSGTGKTARVDGNMDGAKYKTILGKKNVGVCKRPETGFSFLQNNDPKYKARSIIEWFKTKHIQVKTSFKWDKEFWKLAAWTRKSSR